ncbi:hypothetical protein VKT23_002376 [Stygiomarasmius scandens]|uniref:Uncharacterized protein n=1 Tax=Marasmiellus scandens TaxID=2682957 RepID=A0ABR1K3Q0_9AGAR
MTFPKVKGPRNTRPTNEHYFRGMELSRTTSSDSLQSTSSLDTDSDASCQSDAKPAPEESDFFCECGGFCTLKRRAHIRRRHRGRKLRPLPSLPSLPSAGLRPLPPPTVKPNRRKIRNLPNIPQDIFKSDFPKVSPICTTQDVLGWHPPIRHSYLVNKQIDWDILMAEILTNDSCSIIMDDYD